MRYNQCPTCPNRKQTKFTQCRRCRVKKGRVLIDRSRILQLRSEGVRQCEIARITGINHNTIRTICRPPKMVGTIETFYF